MKDFRITDPVTSITSIAFRSLIAVSLAAALMTGAAARPSAPAAAPAPAPGPAATAAEELSGVQRFDGDSVVRVQVRSVKELRMLLALTDDVWSHGVGVGPVDVRISAEAKAALERAGIPFTTLIPDLQAVLDAERQRLSAAPFGNAGADGGGGGGARAGGGGDEGGVADLSWFSDVKNLAQINAQLDAYAAQYPAIASTFVAGNSLEGRPIRGLRISQLPANSGAPTFLFDSCQHAREWATPMVAMYLAEILATHSGNDPRIDAILSKAEILIVPVANPDGYQYTWDVNRMWRKNRRNNGDGSFGVDLNRNWGYQWGGQGASAIPSDETYRGPSAFSEPESQVLRDFTIAHPTMIGQIDFHSYAQLVMWPWAWTNALPPDQALFSAVGNNMAAGIQSMFGKVYVAGPVYSTIYPASGGACDWFYGDQGVFAYAIEVRDTGSYGFIIPPAEVLPCAQENTEAALRMMEGLLVPGTMAPAVPFPTTVAPGTPAPVSITAVPVAGTPSGNPVLMARTGASGPFNAIPMSTAGTNLYTASLPAAACGATIQYWFQWDTSLGSAYLPQSAPSSLFSASVITTTTIFSDDFEQDLGWVVGAAGDNATTGIWVRVDPVGTIAQPEDDHTANGTKCYVTGQGVVGGAAGDNDVDNGVTSLTSPTLDGSDLGATLTYWRWYSNNLGGNPNADTMLVLFSANGGASWQTLETVSSSATAWVQASFTLGSFLPQPGPFKIRFVAQDLGGPSLVEAAVDDVSITKTGCPAVIGDLNGDGKVDGADLGYLLAHWGSADPASDLDHSGNVDGADLGILIAHWAP